MYFSHLGVKVYSVLTLELSISLLRIATTSVSQIKIPRVFKSFNKFQNVYVLRRGTFTLLTTRTLREWIAHAQRGSRCSQRSLSGCSMWSQTATWSLLPSSSTNSPAIQTRYGHPTTLAMTGCWPRCGCATLTIKSIRYEYTGSHFCLWMHVPWWAWRKNPEEDRSSKKMTKFKTDWILWCVESWRKGNFVQTKTATNVGCPRI